MAEGEKDRSETDSLRQEDPNLAVVDRMRDLAKWLVVVFGAIGGVLITGTELADLGSAEGWDVFWACVGVAIGMAGAALALAFTVIVLLPIRLPFRRLAEEEGRSRLGKLVREEPELLRGCGQTIEELRTTLAEADAAVHEAAAAYEADEKDQVLKKRLRAAVENREAVNEAANRFHGFAMATVVKEKMIRAVIATFLGGFLVVVGIGVFSIATNGDDPSTPGDEVVAKQPSAVAVVLSDRGRSLLGEQLGEKCRADPLAAIAMDGTPDALQLVSVPTKTCEAVTFTLTESVGYVIGQEGVNALPRCRIEKPDPPCIAY